MFEVLYQPPWNALLFGFGLIAFVIGEIRGTRLILRAVMSIEHPDREVWRWRGIRACVVGIAFLSVGAGVYFENDWVVLGLVLLGWELLSLGKGLLFCVLTDQTWEDGMREAHRQEREE